MKLQKGNITRTVKNKDIAKTLIEKCGYKEIKEVKETKQKENKVEDNNK